MHCDGHLLLSPAACQVWHKAARTRLTMRPEHNTGFVPHTDSSLRSSWNLPHKQERAANASLGRAQSEARFRGPRLFNADWHQYCVKAPQRLQMLSDRLGDLHKFQAGNKLLLLTIDSPCDQSMNGGRLSVAQHTHTRVTCTGMGVCRQGEGNTACKTTTKKNKS